MYRRVEDGWVISTRELLFLCGQALPLIPATGTATFMVPFPYIPTPFRQRLLRGFGVQLVGIRPGGQIVGHTDVLDPTVRRYHLPLQVNDGCWSFSAGQWDQLKLAGIYAVDPTQPHGAVNWGDTIRLHLMIDVEAS